jgi:hypothetical protein
MTHRIELTRYGLVLASLGAAACGSSGKDMPPLWAPPDEPDAAVDASVDARLAEAAPDVALVDGSAPRAADADAGEEAAPPACPPLGEPIDAALALPPNGVGVCLSSRVFASPVTLAGLPSGSARLAAITPDELTIAWIDKSTTPPRIMFADRAAPTDPFGAAAAIAPATAYLGDEGAALSPDGTRLVVVLASGKGFTEYVRSIRPGSFFAQPSDVQFQAMNQTLGFEMPAAEVFSAPIVGADDQHFYYSRHGGGTAETVYESTRKGNIPWTVGVAPTGDAVQSFCGRGRRPSGISSDLLTIFYWDEASMSERAAWRASPTAPFTGGIDLGARPDTQPSQSCTRIYHTLPASSDIGYEDG